MVELPLFLAQALEGTRLWGAYMADLHPEWAESDSRLIRTTRERVEAAVAALIDQVRLVGEVELIVAVGGKSYSSIRRQAVTIERELGVPASGIRKIAHYSRAAARAHEHDPVRYRQLVRDALPAD